MQLQFSVVTQILFYIHCATADHHENRLYNDLLKNYNNLERPVANYNDPVVVSYFRFLFFFFFFFCLSIGNNWTIGGILSHCNLSGWIRQSLDNSLDHCVHQLNSPTSAAVFSQFSIRKPKFWLSEEELRLT